MLFNLERGLDLLHGLLAPPKLSAAAGDVEEHKRVGREMPAPAFLEGADRVGWGCRS